MEDIEDIIPIRKSEIISASRRTDIPAFYMDMMLEALKNKYIDVKNPYSQKSSRVSLDKKDVKCICWWSKDYGKWIKIYEENNILFSGFKHYFNFTINGTNELEKGVKTTLDERLKQLKYLTKTFGVNAISYRFDPIVYYKKKNDDSIYNNLEHFKYIVKYIAKLGIKEIIFAFCLGYPNVVKRMKKMNKELIILNINEQKKIMDKLLKITDKYGIIMKTCCNNELIGYKNIISSACIDKNKIEKITKKRFKLKRDSGQRKQCNCVQSRDIGDYDMNCKHECAYCYAK